MKKSNRLIERNKRDRAKENACEPIQKRVKTLHEPLHEHEDSSLTIKELLFIIDIFDDRRNKNEENDNTDQRSGYCIG